MRCWQCRAVVQEAYFINNRQELVVNDPVTAKAGVSESMLCKGCTDTMAEVFEEAASSMSLGWRVDG